MFCLALGYPEPFWATWRLCKVLGGGWEGGVYYARARFPLEKSIYTIPTAPSQVSAPQGREHEGCVPVMRDVSPS